MSTDQGSYTRDTVEVKAVHANLHQEIILITEDKLKLVLNEHLTGLEQRRSWIAPLGVLLTILAVFSTSSFKDAYFGAETWEAFFLMGGALATFWLGSSIYGCVKAKSISDIIKEIKKSSVEQ